MPYDLFNLTLGNSTSINDSNLAEVVVAQVAEAGAALVAASLSNLFLDVALNQFSPIFEDQSTTEKQLDIEKTRENNLEKQQQNSISKKSSVHAKKEIAELEKLKENSTFRLKYARANQLLATVRSKAPKKLNFPVGSRTFASVEKSYMKVPKFSSLNQLQQIEEQERSKNWMEYKDYLGKAIDARLKMNLLGELIQIAGTEHYRIKVASHSEYLKNKAKYDAINHFHVSVQDYLDVVQVRLMERLVAIKFEGGTCASQSSLIVIEALKKNIDIEFVELTDQTRPGHSHVITILGRDPTKTKLEAPSTWNNEAQLIDYWANDRVIPAAFLKKWPKKYSLYFYKNWQWQSIFYSSTLPESLKGQFYDQYEQIRAYFKYCQTRLKEMIINFELPDLENNAESKMGFKR